MHRNRKPLEPIHVPGMQRGEEMALKSPEPGRGGRRQYRDARDSTGINPKEKQPILASMPNIPPA
jgi:hypothetical protein